jgi:hypothetical protein
MSAPDRLLPQSQQRSVSPDCQPSAQFPDFMSFYKHTSKSVIKIGSPAQVRTTHCISGKLVLHHPPAGAEIYQSCNPCIASKIKPPT